MRFFNTRSCWILLSAMSLMLILFSLLAAPVIRMAEATSRTEGDALIVKETTGTHWEQLSQLNIFPENEDGTKIIAPNSSGSYTFTVENCARFPFTYTIAITDENIAKIPMLFRLCDIDGNFLIGSEEEWVSISSLKKISGELAYQTATDYTLDWMWPGSDNEADTASGIAAQEEAIYTLNFNIAAEQSGEAILPDGPAQTGDPAKISLALSIMTICVVALTVLVIPVLYDRRSEDE